MNISVRQICYNPIPKTKIKQPNPGLLKSPSIGNCKLSLCFIHYYDVMAHEGMEVQLQVFIT
jgi:hypothetical protein